MLSYLFGLTLENTENAMGQCRVGSPDPIQARRAVALAKEATVVTLCHLEQSGHAEPASGIAKRHLIANPTRRKTHVSAYQPAHDAIARHPTSLIPLGLQPPAGGKAAWILATEAASSTR